LQAKEFIPKIPIEWINKKHIPIQKPRVLSAGFTNDLHLTQQRENDLPNSGKADFKALPPDVDMNTNFLGWSSTGLWPFDNKISPEEEIIEYPTLNDNPIPFETDILTGDGCGPQTPPIYSSHRDITHAMSRESTPPVGAFLNIGAVTATPTVFNNLPAPALESVDLVDILNDRKRLKAMKEKKPPTMEHNVTSWFDTELPPSTLPAVLPWETVNIKTPFHVDNLAIPSLKAPTDIIDEVLESQSLDSGQNSLSMSNAAESTSINAFSREEQLEKKSRIKRSASGKTPWVEQSICSEFISSMLPTVSLSKVKTSPTQSNSMITDQALKCNPTCFPNSKTERPNHDFVVKLSAATLQKTKPNLEKTLDYQKTTNLGYRPPTPSINQKLCTVSALAPLTNTCQTTSVSNANQLIDFDKPFHPKKEGSACLSFGSMGSPLPDGQTDLFCPNFWLKKESKDQMCCPAPRSIGQSLEVSSPDLKNNPLIRRNPHVKVHCASSLVKNLKVEGTFSSHNRFKKMTVPTLFSSKQFNGMARRKRINKTKPGKPVKRQYDPGATRYPCYICGKTFKQKCHLYRHIRQHSGKKRFICEVCSHGFYQRSNLMQHVRTHSTNEMISHRFACHICPKRFTRKQGMLKHVAKTHCDNFVKRLQDVL